MSINRLMQTAAAGAAGGAEGLAIEDAFSTYVYDGTSSTQTITNGINLVGEGDDITGEGGLVWLKRRNGSGNHFLFDTLRGTNSNIRTNAINGEADTPSLGSFDSTGFTLTSDINYNQSGNNYVSWTFRKAPRFFDVVTYTGDGVNGRQIVHDLGVVPGAIIVKPYAGDSGRWAVYHRGLTSAAYTMNLDETFGEFTTGDRWNSTDPDDVTFTVSNHGSVNASGVSYVAYLFAHDPLGPSGDGSDGLISCGSYTGNGSTDGPEIDLGWETQWVLVKGTDNSFNWLMVDNIRGMPVDGDTRRLFPNTTDEETTASGFTYVKPTSTGFKIVTDSSFTNAPGANYIYVAIRRGPMRPPESGSEVFNIELTSDTSPYSVGFPTDMWIAKETTRTFGPFVSDRLRGETKFLQTHSADAEQVDSFGLVDFDLQDDFKQGASSQPLVNWNFRRAPGFFDVVAYTGEGDVGNSVVNHNLAVVPELIICKSRSDNGSGYRWFVQYGESFGSLNLTDSFSDVNWPTPTTTTFTALKALNLNLSGKTYIFYLFASLSGVSKVGSYTGNGSSQTIDCGFTSGARFIMIKRSDSTGDWYVWDTERGIIAGDDPFLELNTTDAEVTNDDSVDPDSAGFIVNQTSTTNVNVSGGEYIFLAIA